MSAGAIDPALLATLVCPLTRGPLRLVGDRLVSDRAGLSFPVTDGLPQLHDGAATLLDQGV